MSTIKVTTLAGRVSGTAPTLSDGATLPSGKTLSGAGGINVTGVSTFSTLNATTVSIAGTLTYEDVTNVDSVGLITARSGIDVTSGIITASSDGINASSNLILKTDNAERVRVDSTGKVGISTGNIDPSGNQLLIRGASTVGTTKGHIMLTGDGATNGEGPQIVFSESGGGSNFAGAYVGHAREGSNSIGNLVFGTRATSGDANTTPTERLRIGNSGQIGLSGANFGTDGQVLTSKGSGAAVEWADAGGVWSLIDKQTITSSTNDVDASFGANAGITTGYSQFKIYYDLWLNSGEYAYMRGAYGFSGTFSNDVKTSDYWYSGFYHRAGETSMQWPMQGENQSSLVISAKNSKKHHSGEMIIFNTSGRLYSGGSVSWPVLSFNAQGFSGGDNDAHNFTVSGQLKGGDNNPLQGVRIYGGSAIIAGEVRTYGLTA